MKSVNLFGNELIFFLDDAPDFVWHIEELELSSNPINEISSEFFEKFFHLKRLMLDRTNITMKPNMFEPLKDLKELRVSALTELTLEWFNGLTNLEKLHVDDSKWEANEEGGEREEEEGEAEEEDRDEEEEEGKEVMINFDHMELVNTLPALKNLELWGHFNCDFVQKLKQGLTINVNDKAGCEERDEE